MAIAAWWKGDVLPALVPIPSFSSRSVQDISELTTIIRLDPTKVLQRINAGHKPYIAYIGEMSVGYGWVARRTATVGELQLSFEIPKKSRYLWDFVTFPEWRGHSIYPHLLQAILRAESRYAQRFWIIYAPENKASRSGIHKAGFRDVGELSFTLQGGVGLAQRTKPSSVERLQAAADLLHVPVLPGAQLLPQWGYPTTTQVTTAPSSR